MENKIRIHLVIDKEVDKKFREKFVRRKGDYSNKIEELIKKVIK